MLHYLRIAAIALCLTACVLLIAMWVRSYWRTDMWQGVISSASATVGSIRGRIGVRIEKLNSTPRYPALRFRSLPSEWIRLPKNKVILHRSDDLFAIVAPHGLLVLLFATLASIPWIKRRFTLRTLLIATTLVAVVLGLIVLL
jgi:hypothetical protein